MSTTSAKLNRNVGHYRTTAGYTFRTRVSSKPPCLTSCVSRVPVYSLSSDSDRSDDADRRGEAEMRRSRIEKQRRNGDFEESRSSGETMTRSGGEAEAKRTRRI